jgi:hypothetical protein
LDDDQCRCIDVTEPNYTALTLLSSDFPIGIKSEEEIPKFGVYRSKWGVLSDHAGHPPIVPHGQAYILRRLASYPWFAAVIGGAREIPEILQRLSASEEVRSEITRLFRERGLGGSDGLPINGPALTPYGALSGTSSNDG